MYAYAIYYRYYKYKNKRGMPIYTHTKRIKDCID